MPMHFVKHGSGTPVLALHGWTPDHRLMTGFLEPFFARRAAARPGGTSYRRLYPDLPGMGQTEITEKYQGSDDMLDAVQGFVDHMIGDVPFIVVGESYGGYLARAVANSRPEQALGLALVCPIGKEARHSRRTLPPHTVIAADPAFMAGLPPADAASYGELAVVQSPETFRRFRDEIAPGLALADDEGLVRVARRYELSTAPESGAPFERPTLIVTGRQDDNTGYADVYALLEHYPRATFTVLDRAGHNLQLEQPVLLDAFLDEWLDRVEEAAGH
ncbi:alpha/beta fold hydrolase [Glycomyces algeriensis]|uniref:Alpha/beta hydrolase n=1 Tax=Glycomyces algeriensis TaxID=256037 RepID=A0A9W6LHW0_9ACTN|nr:alpha/beta hydrolase [Glycomyces algeriensis]MDA1364328.1 alpha/beta hydrolase [Glycomyces algeriensis]MDR7350361.1 pimeloyl-ACP methyl ester carboxylesterase [Glycomyces algeriensis]GLI43066.1 alpha/beta hydrolase [Glycomyces algeriensis]